uniref:Toll-like receptor 4 n=2 Tax=Bursaphelenchus xylophilus TaxID=6326 RepID=A0A1I7SGK9_BURXY
LITSIASSPRAQDVRTLIFHCSEPLGHVLATPASPIEELTLSNCGISSITIGKSHTGTALKHLDLSKNNLTTVPYFGYLPELTELDLADNSIRSIREGSFTFNEKLETIDLSRNNIKRIELNAFERPLKKITLDENLKVVCDKDWPLFLRYATKNNVEWSLPGSNDVQCDSE